MDTVVGVLSRFRERQFALPLWAFAFAAWLGSAVFATVLYFSLGQLPWYFSVRFLGAVAFGVIVSLFVAGFLAFKETEARARFHDIRDRRAYERAVGRRLFPGESVPLHWTPELRRESGGRARAWIGVGACALALISGVILPVLEEGMDWRSVWGVVVCFLVVGLALMCESVRARNAEELHRAVSRAESAG